ncbi:NUDIX hydrolase domain-like protein [Pyronema omphalodes]|nr:NUDIX hydrolase domain-like protein [Pyronema omphalodes]
MSYNATYHVGTGAVLDYASGYMSQKFGPEVINYFSGSPINRVSFLRGNTEFLSAALPLSKFMLLNNTWDPLSISAENLYFAEYPTVEKLIGNPYSVPEDELIAAYNSTLPIPPTLLFLGLDESDTSSGFKYNSYSGQPYFAIAVGDWDPKVENAEWRRTRFDLKLVRGHAAMLAQARTLLDWNSRNVFCSMCGGRTISVNAGTKRVCPGTDNGKALTECKSRVGVHNIAFPRTDPTVIMAIVNSTGDKVLLGRQRRWPEAFYSTLAGFCEPAESIEEAVRRETWEESGVKVGRVVVHSSQPWPYPASLMIGCIGEALPGGEEIHLGHDPELHMADWYDIKFIREMLAKPARGLDEGPPEGFQEGDIRLPPSTAIAHQLLQAVSNNFHGGLKI